jgi:hypothetical protein
VRLPRFIVDFLWRRYEPLSRQEPDEIIGHNARSRLSAPGGHGATPVKRPFLMRWFVAPKNRLCNRYLHKFIRDDEDRALHDHPWFNVSILLKGQYIEHTIDKGGVHRKTLYAAGDVKFRSPWAAHRVELLKEYPSPQYGTSPQSIPSWSLFITGPVQHKWGFHCPESWITHHTFHDRGGCE